MIHAHQFARQPIVDRMRRTVAYEVLFRSDIDARDAGVVDGVGATTSVLAALAAPRADRCDGLPRFVNLPRRMLVERAFLDLDPTRIAIEVLEDVAGDATVLSALADLRAGGFTIALDDFRPDPERVELLAYADIVKLDVQDLGMGELEGAVDALLGLDVTLLAEKVESEDEFETCLRLGFDMFQGFHIARPEMVTISRTRLITAVFGKGSSPVKLAATGWAGQVEAAEPLSL